LRWLKDDLFKVIEVSTVVEITSHTPCFAFSKKITAIIGDLTEFILLLSVLQLLNLANLKPSETAQYNVTARSNIPMSVPFLHKVKVANEEEEIVSKVKASSFKFVVKVFAKTKTTISVLLKLDVTLLI
jgi:hypothetical protein